jgi:arabinan endo-1,5-alpha-L-arabinosidase
MGPTYCNPVHDGYFADPYVAATPDGYVAVGTGGSVAGREFEVLTSPDLVSWTSVGGALEPVSADLGTDYWAPELAEQDGTWFLYYSVGHGDSGHHIRVAVSDRPTGPYRDQGLNLTPDERFAIDAHAFRDDDGTWYLFYARDVLDGDRVGTMLAVDVLEGMTSLRGQPRTILRPTGDWQVYQRGREMYGQVHDWHTLEGPFVRKHDGRYYCFYSGGNWHGDGYAVAYAVADHPLGPWTEPPEHRPLLRTVPGKVLGPGHNSVVATPEGDVVVYHAWDLAQTRRQLCIDPLRWTDEGPTLDWPSREPRTL